VPFICLAYLIAGLANCLGNGLVVAGKLRTLAMFAALAAVTNLVLNVLLIPRLGVYGAAAATILAFAIQLGGILVSLARHYPVPLEWRRLAGFAFAFLAPLATSWFMPPMPLAVDVAARLALLSACPILVVALGLIRPRELGILRQQLVDWRLLSSTGVRVAEDGPADPGGAA
jgi:O-antigen/teichoic acid export membrane protein